MLRVAIALVFVLALAAGIVTFLAAESQEVVVLRTERSDGSIRRTRIWIAEDGGDSWIEAANPERAFYADLLARPDVEIERRGEIDRFRATPLPGPEGHEKIRGLLRTKYGWSDRWLGLIVDTSRSIAVRLDPRREAPVVVNPDSPAR
jgi:hypothetical protein